MGAVRCRSCGERERATDVGREVVLRRSSVADRVAVAARRRRHRERRPRCEPLIAPWPVDDVRADPDRRDVVVVPVDARRSLVCELEDPIQGRGRDSARLGSGGGVGGVVDSRRARVREPANAIEPRLDRLEDDDGSVHVDASAALGVRATERHLQRGEVDDVRYPWSSRARPTAPRSVTSPSTSVTRPRSSSDSASRRRASSEPRS